jgi:hypothetical protein
MKYYIELNTKSEEKIEEFKKEGFGYRTEKPTGQKSIVKIYDDEKEWARRKEEIWLECLNGQHNNGPIITIVSGKSEQEGSSPT